MCEFSAKCKAEATYNVIHKAVGARESFTRTACDKCASMIGKGGPGGALIDQPGMESNFYKLEKIGAEKSKQQLLAEIEAHGLKVEEADSEVAKEMGSEPWFDVYRAGDNPEHLECFDSFDDAIDWAADHLGLTK